MANLDSLNYPSISDMSTDEAIEYLRQIRLSRRVPVKSTKTKTTSKTASKTIAKKAVKNLDKQSINELLDMIGD